MIPSSMHQQKLLQVAKRKDRSEQSMQLQTNLPFRDKTHKTSFPSESQLSSSAVENTTRKARRMKLHDLTWQFAMKEFFKLWKINFFVIRKIVYHFFAQQMLSGFSLAMYKVLKLIWETARILIIRRGENYLMKGYHIGNKNLRLSPQFFCLIRWVLGERTASGPTPHKLVSQFMLRSQEANSSKRQTRTVEMRWQVSSWNI